MQCNECGFLGDQTIDDDVMLSHILYILKIKNFRKHKECDVSRSLSIEIDEKN